MKILDCRFILSILFFGYVLGSCSSDRLVDNQLNRIKGEISQNLSEGILAVWYPKCIDVQYGGYLSAFTSTFEPAADQDKMIVTQARHMWVNSKAYLRYGDSTYLQYATQGFSFLEEKMWDKEYGGFYQLVKRNGDPVDPDETIKTAYGNSFGIYGLAAYFRASGDSAALDLAKKTFNWLENNSHDPEYQGYFQHLTRKGDVIQRNDSTPSVSDLGYKDQNSSIHLLEAFTELYMVWPDTLLRNRLSEMFHLIRDTIVNKNNYMDLFFTSDWKPVSFRDYSRDEIMKHIYLDHVSFGHDIETAYLLLEASEALGIEYELTLNKTKKIVDHVLRYGWDEKRGGIYDGAYYFDLNQAPEIVMETKSWWSEAEALNTLLLFHYYFPDDGFDSLFFKQWSYIQNYLIDNINGGWFTNGLDTDPDAVNKLKGQIWKSTYHNYRALANCIDMLEEAGISSTER